MLLKAYRIRNDSCITCLYAVHSRQPGGGRCCSSDISFGFLKEASTCRIEAFRDIQFERILRPKPDGGKDGADGLMAGPAWAKALGVR